MVWSSSQEQDSHPILNNWRKAGIHQRDKREEDKKELQEKNNGDQLKKKKPSERRNGS